jgi:Rrf2 family protein
MQVSAKIDYAVRALVELARSPDCKATREELAERQDIPGRYLEAILGQLRKSGLITSRRGSTGGGYALAVPANQITVADVSRAVDGPLTLVQGLRPDQLNYEGTAKPVGELWIGMRAAIRSVMESVTIDDLARGTLPTEVQRLVDDPDAWAPRFQR